MRYDVLLTAGAEDDLVSIHAYLAGTEGSRAADRLLRRLLDLNERLGALPERGSHPKELLALGMREYRQVMMRPYRIIYRVIGQQVLVMVIADVRRDMQSLLVRRLLGA